MRVAFIPERRSVGYLDRHRVQVCSCHPVCIEFGLRCWCPYCNPSSGNSAVLKFFVRRSSLVAVMTKKWSVCDPMGKLAISGIRVRHPEVVLLILRDPCMRTCENSRGRVGKTNPWSHLCMHLHRLSEAVIQDRMSSRNSCIYRMRKACPQKKRRTMQAHHVHDVDVTGELGLQNLIAIVWRLSWYHGYAVADLLIPQERWWSGTIWTRLWEGVNCEARQCLNSYRLRCPKYRVHLYKKI